LARPALTALIEVAAKEAICRLVSIFSERDEPFSGVEIVRADAKISAQVSSWQILKIL
jgi:hypothetical protein